MKFTRTIVREVTLKAATQPIADRTWVLEIGPHGVIMHPKGSQGIQNKHGLTWRDIIGYALAHNTTLRYSPDQP